VRAAALVGSILSGLESYQALRFALRASTSKLPFEPYPTETSPMRTLP
jgi:hypothetical protein